MLLVRAFLCVLSAFVGALNLGVQGNGNLVPAGFFLGALLGSACSALLVFGPLAFVNRLRPPVQLFFWVSSSLLAIMLIVFGVGSINK